MREEALSPIAKRNIEAIRDIETELSRRRNRIEHISYKATAFIGSFHFLALQLILLFAWVGINVAPTAVAARFDPFPFEFLNFLIGIEAPSPTDCAASTIPLD
jgi:uncharacterized membrane protein